MARLGQRMLSRSRSSSMRVLANGTLNRKSQHQIGTKTGTKTGTNTGTKTKTKTKTGTKSKGKIAERLSKQNSLATQMATAQRVLIETTIPPSNGNRQVVSSSVRSTILEAQKLSTFVKGVVTSSSSINSQVEKGDISKTGIAKTYRTKKVGKKTKKQILYNSEQKQILLRELRKAEAEVGRGPTFFTKFLGGLGFYPGEGKDPNQYIARLQSKIQHLDNSIVKSESRLEKKLAVAQNNATKKNLEAKQKAINHTKHYRDLLSKYIDAEIETAKEANAIKKERAEKKKTKTHILNKNINSNIQKLFANTLNLRNANITTSTDA